MKERHHHKYKHNHHTSLLLADTPKSLLDNQNSLALLHPRKQALDQHVRPAQPLPRPLAYTRRHAIQIPCSLSNAS